MIAKTPNGKYYAVIFTSQKSDVDTGYAEMSERLVELARMEPGFLGLESARNELGITVSYWSNLKAIKNWRNNIEHAKARAKGKELWYSSFKVRICEILNDYEFEK